MENYHGASGSTIKGTGGKRGRASDKKLRLVGGTFTATKVGKSDVKLVRHKRGNTYKIKLKTAKFVNVLLKDGKMQKVAMRTVLETPDNRHHARVRAHAHAYSRAHSLTLQPAPRRRRARARSKPV